MKKINITCMLIVSIIIGASAVTSVSAGEIDNGSLDITINDDLWGTVSPIVNIPDQTSVTLDAVKYNETSYEVRDNVSIPLTITCDKPIVLSPKKVFTLVKVKRGLFGEKLMQSAEIVPVYNGTIFYDGVVPDSITVNARYNISGETFANGEKLKLIVYAIGLWAPGKGSPNEFGITLKDIIDGIPEEDQGLIIRILKQFVDFGFEIDLSSFPIFARKAVDLNVDYVLAGEEEPPVGYTLDVDVPNGNGSVTISPAQELYDDGDVVTLTAVPEAGYVFSEWTGDITGTDNPIEVTMDENKIIYAHFIEAPVKIEAKGGFASVKLTISNQRDYELSGIEYNLTMEGGILGKISKQINGTIDSIAIDGNFVLNTPKVMFALGKSTINLELIIPGEGVTKETFSATHIGPIILVK